MPAVRAETAALLQQYADQVCRHQPVPGGSLVVVDRKRELLRLTFGVADHATGRAPQPEHLYQVASISKSFTALAVLMLAQEGFLDLDEPVIRRLPWVELGPWTQQVTLRHLLSHTAGLVMGGEGLPDAVALAWSLRERASAEPGRFHYSNHGYLLLGLLVAQVEGRPLADVLRDRVFEPLGIEADALGRVTHADRHRFATGSTRAYADLPWAPGDPLTTAAWTEMDGADGCVALSARGLGRYLLLLLGDGTVAERRVVPPGVLTRLGTPTAPSGEDVLVHPGYPEVTSSRYGLGLNVEVVGGHTCLTHGGGNLGYASFLLADTDLGVGIGVLTNADGDSLAAQRLARVAHQVLFAGPEAAPPVADLPPADLRVRAGGLPPSLLGRFVAPGGEAGFEVEVVATAEGVEVRGDGTTGRLWATLTGRYVTDHPGLRRFHLDPSDDGSGWIHGGDRLLPAGVPASQSDVADAAAYVGHYRSWTPWFPDLRIVARGGHLLLTAPGGVEAPAQDEVLVPVDARGTWRIGADEWLPERLVELARVDGRVVLLDRDGATYSRSFTP